MPRERLYVRRFLNTPGHHGGAYLLLSVSDTDGEAGSYVESHVRFEIADCVRNVQLDFPLHGAAARRNSLRKARLLASAVREFEQALAAEAKVAAARDRARYALRGPAEQVVEWMVHVEADVPGLEAAAEDVVEALHERLEHASASVSTSSGRLAVTLTLGGSCATDAAQIGEWMVRAAIAASGLHASNVRAEVEFTED
jgi:hypothetical protein